MKPFTLLGRLALAACLLLAACQPAAPLPAPTQPPAPAAVTPLTAAPSPSPLPPTPTATLTPRPPLSPLAGERSAGDPYAPELGNTGYDVQRYHLQLRLDPARVRLEGQAAIAAVSTLDGLAQLALDFAGYEIGALAVDGQPADYSREAAKLVVELPELLPAGQAFTVTVTYAGEPLSQPSPFVPFLGHIGPYFLGSSAFTLSEPDGARLWFPCNDHPRDKAAFRIELSVPPGMTGVANGSLVAQDPSPDGWTTFVWNHPYPMAPYLALFAVGEYERIEAQSPGGIPLRHYVHPDLRAAFEAQAGLTGEALDWMANLLGPYPFEAFGFVTTRLVSFASETQTMVILPETSLNEETIVHELAHMWLGDWVSLDSWGDMWLKEGLAIYLSLVWQTRQEPAGLDIFMQARTASVLEKASPYPLNNLPRSQLLGYDTYWRGAALIHALRQQVGDQAFFNGLRQIVAQYGGGTLSQAQFRQVMEESSGLSLEAFFAEWLP